MTPSTSKNFSTGNNISSLTPSTDLNSQTVSVGSQKLPITPSLMPSSINTTCLLPPAGQGPVHNIPTPRVSALTAKAGIPLPPPVNTNTNQYTLPQPIKSTTPRATGVRLVNPSNTSSNSSTSKGVTSGGTPLPPPLTLEALQQLLPGSTISESEYREKSKADANAKHEYARCSVRDCRYPSYYHLKKHMFYSQTKDNISCRMCFKVGMKGMHGSLCCEDSTNSSTPIDALCFSKATWGFPGGEPRRCVRHKENGMINVNTGLCQFISPGPNGKRCNKRAEYGFTREAGKRPRRERCPEHCMEGMIMVALRRNKRARAEEEGEELEGINREDATTLNAKAEKK